MKKIRLFTKPVGQKGSQLNTKKLLTFNWAFLESAAKCVKTAFLVLEYASWNSYLQSGYNLYKIALALIFHE